MKANGLNEVFFATILLGLNGYFIGTANGNEEEDFTVEEFPEDLMPPPIRDDFSIRDEMSQNNLIQDKDMPKFGEPLLNITIPVGREALLSCVVDNLQTYKIAWLRVDTQTILTIQTHVITKNHRMVVTHAEKRAWQLKIRDVKESDKGWYMCQINTDPMKSQIAYLDVVVPPDILDYPTSTDMVVKEGSNVTLKCSATGSPPPTITFRREDGGPIKLPAGNEVYSINGSSFSISRVDRLDMGAFLCIASNGIPPSVSKRVMLIVHFPPMVTIQNQLVGAPLGQNATLECTSEAFPKSINYWMRAIDKNDSIITSGNKYVQDVHENVYKVTMKLTIIDVDITDFGTYKCLAKNSLGETDGSIKLYSNWILIVVHFLKYIQLNELIVPNTDEHSWPSDKNGSLLFFIGVSALGSYVLYFGIGGFLHGYFYVRQRDQSHEWKCQPNKFLTPDVERHEILLGSFSLFVVSVLTGTISWYAANDGKYLTIYYHANEYGWIWFFLQIPLVFIYQDYMDYLTHRLYHYPFLYKYFHKLHHKYKQPTAFSVTAIHPIEMVHMQMVLASPIVLMPVHWILFYIILLYTYYHGIIDHSGITFKAQWWQPWQPDAIFHDNHHQYFHVNYGFNMFLWDKLHGTFRLKDRVYSEDIFYGKGKAISDVSPEVLAKDIAERKSENPHAYRGDYNENELTEQDLKLN